MKINKKIISIASAAALILNLLFPAFTRAYSIDLGPYVGSVDIDINEILQEANFSSISQITDDALQSSTEGVEERYGFNENAWRAAKRKMSAPRAEVFFDNANPKVGEKVTAHAIPEFFKNDPQNLYYTWYIIHTKDGSIQTATNTVREGMIEASRIMARGDYDPDLDGQIYDDPDKDPDKDGWPAVDASSYEDEDKTAAPMGGADGVGGLSEEMVEAFSSATEWCDSLDSHAWNDCSYHDATSFKPLDTYYTPNTGQSNHYCSLCENYFSGDGASSYTSAKTAKNNCCYANTPESSLQCSETSEVTDPDTGETTEETTYFKCPQSSGTDYCGVTYNSLFDSCYETFKDANISNVTTCLDGEYESCRTNWATVHEDLNGDGFSDYSEEDTTQVSRCYKHNFGTSNGASTFRENELSDSSTEDSSGLDVSVACKHKWPNATDYKSGSGKFSTGEEKEWKTDPTDPDTDGDGFVDEADIIGLGQESFTWTYQQGDRVGFVAEGTSMTPTDEKTSYYKIMWGYLDVCDSSKTGLMENDQCDDSGDYGYGFLATKAPGEEKGEENLKVSLSYSPDNPIADPSDDNADNIREDGTISDADRITVSSSLDNTSHDPNNLYYTWQISEGGSPSSDSWSEIGNVNDYFDTDSSLNGIGKTSLNFIPKESALEGEGDISYFKVTLTVSTAAEKRSGRGRSSVVIGINKKGIKIKLFKVDVKDGKAILGKEVCAEGLYKTLCPAVQYQMLAAKVDGSKYSSGSDSFMWSLNGKALSVPNNLDNFFDGWGDTSVFFPITGEEKTIENITVTATSKEELNPVIGGRSITVVKPALIIKPLNSSVSWPVTYTVENTFKKYSYNTIESSSAFQALTEEEISYYLNFVPDYLIDGDTENTMVDWNFNGASLNEENVYDSVSNVEEIMLEDNDRTIKFRTGIYDGQSFTLGAKVKKYWGNDERIILYNAWDIVPETLEGNSSITITTTSEEPMSTEDEAWGTNAQAGPGQILAAIGTHLPHYAMYVLRLVLTIFVMFFLSIGFYGLTQKVSLYEEK